MNKKTFSMTAGIVFLIVSTLHFLRSILGWELTISGWAVPMWVSWLAALLVGYLAYQGLKANRK